MNRAACVFAAEAAPNGTMGEETRLRCKEVIAWYYQEISLNNSPVILVAAGITNLRQLNSHADQMRTVLLAASINPDHVIVVSESAMNTAEEIEAFEVYLKTHDTFFDVFVVSSWYHTGRIQLAWHKRCGRETRALGAPTFAPTYMKRAKLEPFKLLVEAVELPPWLHRLIGKAARATGRI